jgi:hypothetical protein
LPRVNLEILQAFRTTEVVGRARVEVGSDGILSRNLHSTHRVLNVREGAFRLALFVLHFHRLLPMARPALLRNIDIAMGGLPAWNLLSSVLLGISVELRLATG